MMTDVFESTGATTIVEVEAVPGIENSNLDDGSKKIAFIAMTMISSTVAEDVDPLRH